MSVSRWLSPWPAGVVLVAVALGCAGAATVAAGEGAAAGKDDLGLIFKVVRADYGDGTQIGLLPKYVEWANKDAPDRIWREEMGNEVWIV